MNITEVILAQEDYVTLKPEDKTSFEYKLAYLIKEEIRTHKWVEGEKGRALSWAEARDEWMKLYYGEFIKFARKNLNKRPARKISYSLHSYERRQPVISGSSL